MLSVSKICSNQESKELQKFHAGAPMIEPLVRVSILAWPVSHMTLGKAFHVSKSQFSHVLNGYSKGTYLP